MQKKRIVWSIVLAAVALFSAWMLWPRSLAGAFDATAQLSVGVIRSGVEDGKPWHDSSETYELAADSDQGAAIQTVLEQYRYHLCLDTLTRKDVIQNTGTLHLQLYSVDAHLSVFNETGKFFLDGRVLRVGYWGSGKAESLCNDLLTVLRAE